MNEVGRSWNHKQSRKATRSINNTINKQAPIKIINNATSKDKLNLELKLAIGFKG